MECSADGSAGVGQGAPELSPRFNALQRWLGPSPRYDANPSGQACPEALGVREKQRGEGLPATLRA